MNATVMTNANDPRTPATTATVSTLLSSVGLVEGRVGVGLAEGRVGAGLAEGRVGAGLDGGTGRTENRSEERGESGIHIVTSVQLQTS